MRFVIVAGLLFFAIPAGSQQVLSPLSTKVIISGQDCQRLVKHIPSPDVSYKPGVDVHGKPVAPADLPGSGGTFQLPDHIEFNYTINPTAYGLAKNPSSTATALQSATNTQMSVATIRYDFGSGIFTINGKPLDPLDQQGVAVECRKQGVK
jgi:hypothetical protein